MKMELRNGNEKHETAIMVVDGLAVMYGQFADL